LSYLLEIRPQPTPGREPDQRRRSNLLPSVDDVNRNTDGSLPAACVIGFGGSP
jgi:hypothetical protein